MRQNSLQGWMAWEEYRDTTDVQGCNRESQGVDGIKLSEGCENQEGFL